MDHDYGMDHDVAPDPSSCSDDEPRVKRGRRVAKALLIGPLIVYLFCASTRNSSINQSPLDPTSAEELMDYMFDIGDTPHPEPRYLCKRVASQYMFLCQSVQKFQVK